MYGVAENEHSGDIPALRVRDVAATFQTGVCGGQIRRQNHIQTCAKNTVVLGGANRSNPWNTSGRSCSLCVRSGVAVGRGNKYAGLCGIQKTNVVGAIESRTRAPD